MNASAAQAAFRIAVASNFLNTANKLVDAYSNDHKSTAEIISGSTGKLYAQINFGAPYDVFLAGDSVRPMLLSKARQDFANISHVYAVGQLVLWAPNVSNDEQKCSQHLLEVPFKYIALANPETAPYGEAALTTLRKLKKIEILRSKLVYGENVSQVLSYILTGSAEAGFLSLSQVLTQDPLRETCMWLIPQLLYPKLTQSIIVLKTNNASALSFEDFVLSEQGVKIIHESGYLLP